MQRESGIDVGVKIVPCPGRSYFRRKALHETSIHTGTLIQVTVLYVHTFPLKTLKELSTDHVRETGKKRRGRRKGYHPYIDTTDLGVVVGPLDPLPPVRTTSVIRPKDPYNPSSSRLAVVGRVDTRHYILSVGGDRTNKR